MLSHFDTFILSYRLQKKFKAKVCIKCRIPQSVDIKLQNIFFVKNMQICFPTS